MITAHVLVKNEENFIWYSIMSVIPFVDKILIWDTGSTDKTVEIIKSIKSSKISFEEKGEADSERISILRNEMLLQTKTDWIMVLDGDEVWYKDALVESLSVIKNNKRDVLIHPAKILIGDIFHYQEEGAGRYKIGNKVGHYNLRFFRNMEGFSVIGNYPDEAYVTRDGIKLQNLNNIHFAELPYLHASHLRRSSRDSKKIKYEIGLEFPKDFYYPESFFIDRPKIVKNVWENMDSNFKLRAFVETPLKKVRRKLW